MARGLVLCTAALVPHLACQRGGGSPTDDSDVDDSAHDSDSAPETGDDTGGFHPDTGPWSSGNVVLVDDVRRAQWTGDVKALVGFDVGFGDFDGLPGDEVVVSAPTTLDFESTGPLNGILYVLSPSASGASDVAVDAMATIWSDDVSSLDGLGWSIDPSSDLDGDGFGDLVVGAPNGGYAQSGLVFVVAGPLGGEIRADLDAYATWVGDESFGAAGAHVAASDLDADGDVDVGIGVPLKGLVEVLPATASGLLDRSDVLVQFVGETSKGSLGYAFDNVGDFDGDGVSDVSLGAPTEHAGAGAVYVLQGPVEAEAISLGDADVIIEGEHTDTRLGFLVEHAGDLDGDGADDFLTNAYGDDVRTGELFVVQGGTDAPASSSEIGISVRGEIDFDMMGDSAVVTDRDGDGVADLVVGAPGNYAYSFSPGKVYVFDGPLTGPLDAADDAAFVLRGEEAADMFGFHVAASDLDGDDSSDFLIGAPFSDAATLAGGSAYLVMASDLP